MLCSLFVHPVNVLLLVCEGQVREGAALMALIPFQINIAQH